MRPGMEDWLRRLTGFEGRFSAEYDRFWIDLQEKYKAVGHPSDIPAALLPIWIELAKLKGVPMEAPKAEPVPLPEPSAIPKERLDFRPRKAAAVGA